MGSNHARVAANLPDVAIVAVVDPDQEAGRRLAEQAGARYLPDVSLLGDRGWPAPGALVIVERATRSGPVSWPDGFVPDKARRYGEATFWYGRAPKSPRSPKAPHNDQASP